MMNPRIDLIGAIHGHADELDALLKKLATELVLRQAGMLAGVFNGD